MASGVQSKEGLYELLFDELKKQGMSGKNAHEACVKNIDKVIPELVREDKSQLKVFLIQMGAAFMQAGIKM